MKKIMFYSMTMQNGGAERVIANLANEFVKENEVAIATLVNSRIDYDLDKKINIIPSSNNDKIGVFSRLKNCFNLLKSTNKYNPDIIIAFCPTMCFIACFFKIFVRKFKKIKLIISERNDPNSEYTTLLLKNTANFLYSKADIVVFQTTGAKEYFNKKVQAKGVIIPNPINDKFLNYNTNVKKENSIVNVGRLEPQKNQELLIKACSKVFKKYPDWKLKIYGEGSLKIKLELLIKELNMENNIFLLGRCNELEKELPKNKIFVLSSNYEGMPNALMEAMASGLACISTDCPSGGSRDLIEDGKNGILVPVNNEQTLVDALNNIINSKELYMQLCNSDISLYSVDIIFSSWKKLI